MSSDKPAATTETAEATEGALNVPPKDEITPPGETASPSATTAAAAQAENAPPKPLRPASKLDQDIATLKEAFPDTDTNVIKAILQASGGKIEPAFNALLGMTDPSFQVEEHPPPQPPRPVPSDNQTSTSLTQLEADELYARQLAEHYSGRGGGGPRRSATQLRSQRPQQRPEEEREHSFLDDDLPVIKENIRKGFLETQSKVNKFLSDFKRKLDGEESEDPADHGGTSASAASPAPRPGQHQFPPRGASRGSGDAYDADPRLLGEDFSHLEIKDNTGGENQQRSSRPIANPNLFTSGNRPPSGHSGAMPPSAMRQPSPTSAGPGATAAGGGAAAANPPSKWAPLEAVEPTPLSNDPFSLGDSDDDHETAPSGGKTTAQESGVTATDKDKEKK